MYTTTQVKDRPSAAVYEAIVMFVPDEPAGRSTVTETQKLQFTVQYKID